MSESQDIPEVTLHLTLCVYCERPVRRSAETADLRVNVARASNQAGEVFGFHAHAQCFHAHLPALIAPHFAERFLTGDVR